MSDHHVICRHCGVGINYRCECDAPCDDDFAELRERVARCLYTAASSGGIDGGHHKAWVIDQMVRHLTGDGYEMFVAAAKAGEDGPGTYSWDVGGAP